MTAKRILTICVLALLLCSCIGAILPVNAEAGWTAEMKIERIDENTAEATITVRVSVEQITCQSGIFGALYNIRYDNSVLELISWENSKPTGWGFSGADPDAVDFTRLRQTEDAKKETYLDYQMVNTATTGGVKKNGELYTDLHFKVLSDSAESAEVTLTGIRLIDVATDQCALPDQKCMIGLHGNADSPVEPVESSEPDESSLDDPQNTEDPASSEPAESGDDSTDASLPSSEGTPPSSDESAEITSKKVRMWITVEDITDPAGVSGLVFTLKYNTSFLQYVSHECLLPKDWDLQSEFTEDLTQPTNGKINFMIMNYDAGHGVKENGVLGVLVEFTFAGTDFDPSLLTIENMQLINDEVSEMSVDSYRLATRYEFNGEAISDNSFSSDGNEGSTLKICIAIIAVVAVLAAAVATFLIIRKKKLA